MAPKSEPPWIFVSHASADLGAVRTVRNHLEQLGAAPLLFHLKALTRPREFWPLIEKEIQERTFFLYCESGAAEKSEWSAVEKAAKRKPKRIGRLRVDREAIDLEALTNFVAKTRVFIQGGHGSYVTDFEDAFAAAGFETEDGWAPDVEAWQEMRQWRLEEAAQNGWVLVFLSRSLIDAADATAYVKAAMKHGADRVVPILLADGPMPSSLTALLATLKVFDASKARRDAPAQLIRELLTR